MLQGSRRRPTRPSRPWKNGTGTSRNAVFGCAKAALPSASPLFPPAPRRVVRTARSCPVVRLFGRRVFVLNSLVLSFVVGDAACGRLRAAVRQKPAVESSDDRLPADEAGERALGRRLAARFRTHRAAHFTIISDAEQQRVDVLIGRIEHTYRRVRAFARGIEMSTTRPSSKMTVVLFDRWDDYRAFAGETGLVVSESVPGVYDYQGNRSLMFNFANATLIREKRAEIERARRRIESRGSVAAQSVEASSLAKRVRDIEGQIDRYERLINATVVRHEIAHQVLRNLGFQPRTWRTRRWLVEGLAMQFEGDSAENPHRLADLKAASAESWKTALVDLVGDPRRIGPGSADASRMYAVAWALVRFLRETRPTAFSEYLAADRAGVGRTARDRELAAFVRHFGAIETIATQFGPYVESLESSVER